MTEEKKYYLAGTDEEVMIGDLIEVPMTKKFKDGQKIKRVMECRLTEETIPDALDMGLIIEAEPEDNKDRDNEGLLDFNDVECPFEDTLNDVIETQEELEKRIDKLEDKVKLLSRVIADTNKIGYDLTQFIHELVKEFSNKKETKKETASSKKK